MYIKTSFYCRGIFLTIDQFVYLGFFLLLTDLYTSALFNYRPICIFRLLFTVDRLAYLGFFLKTVHRFVYLDFCWYFFKNENGKIIP